MSKITNDGLTRSGTGCSCTHFLAVPRVNYCSSVVISTRLANFAARLQQLMHLCFSDVYTSCCLYTSTYVPYTLAH